MKTNIFRARLRLALPLAFLLAGNAFVSAQNPVDVYFIAGQSNAGNIGEQNGTGTSDVGFNLTFGRVVDGGSDTNPGTVVDSYSSNLLNLNHVVNQLAVSLHQGNDIAIYAFGRNGKPLSNVPDSSDGGESWYPGDGTTNYDAELYGQFQNWSSARLSDLSAAGNTPTVKGVFWFQGERDVQNELQNIDNMAADNYATNFENLISRFRADFNQDVIVIGSKLRIITNANQQALNDQVGAALASVAVGDPLVGVVETTVNADGTGGPLPNRFSGASGFNTDVHFSNSAQELIADRWAAMLLSLTSGAIVPDQTISFANVTSHNHVSANSNPIAAASTITESPFFAGAPASNGLSGDVAFNNNPVTTGPVTSPTATISGTFTLIGNSSAAGGFTNGNSLPNGITATYDISFDLSTTDGSNLSAALSEANGLGAGNGDAFFTPTNANFSGNLIFGAATISDVSFTGTPTDTDYVFSNGTVDSIDLVGITSNTFTGTNDAILTDTAGNTVVEFATSPTAGETLIDGTNNNLFAAQELGEAVFAVTNGGAHIRGFSLAANISFDIAASSILLKGDVDMDGDVDFDDIPAFIAVLQAGVFQAEADCDCSAVVDFADIPAFIAILQSQ